MTAELRLPDSPGYMKAAAQETKAVVAPTAGGIRGTILDKNQGIVPDAKIVLERLEKEEVEDNRTTTSDSGGNFSFKDLPAGKYIFTVTSPGLETFISSEITLKEGQSTKFP